MVGTGSGKNEKGSYRLNEPMTMSPTHPPPQKKNEQNQTGCLELSWREKMNNELFPQLFGFLVTCPKIDEPKAIPDISFFPPFALFLAP